MTYTAHALLPIVVVHECLAFLLPDITELITELTLSREFVGKEYKINFFHTLHCTFCNLKWSNPIIMTVLEYLERNPLPLNLNHQYSHPLEHGYLSFEIFCFLDHFLGHNQTWSTLVWKAQSWRCVQSEEAHYRECHSHDVVCNRRKHTTGNGTVMTLCATGGSTLQGILLWDLLTITLWF